MRIVVSVRSLGGKRVAVSFGSASSAGVSDEQAQLIAMKRINRARTSPSKVGFFENLSPLVSTPR